MVSQFDNNGSISEMAIVDIFTQLIFDAETVVDETGQRLLDMLKHLEPILADATQKDLSEYLRSMEVREMIKVVEIIKDQFDHYHLLSLSRHYLHGSSLPR